MIDEITFIIIGKNEAINLPKCFSSIKKISNNIIFVDSDSSDNSIEIAKEHAVKTILKVKSNNGTPSLSRSVGAKYAQTEYIHFVDGDMEVDADWPNNAIAKLKLNNHIAVVHGYKKVYTKNFKDYFILSDSKDWQADYLQGAFLIKREIYNRVGGLDSRFYGEEERDLYIRIRSVGYQVWYLHQLMASHYDLKKKTIKHLFFSDSSATIWIPLLKSIKNNTLLSYMFVYRLALVALFLDIVTILCLFKCSLLGVLLAIIFQIIELLYCILIKRKGYFIIWKTAIINIHKVFKIWFRKTSYHIEEIN